MRTRNLLAIIAIAVLLTSCTWAGLQLVKPGPGEMAAIAESVGETVIVFLPEKYLTDPQVRKELAYWQIQLLELKDKLEADEPITGNWIKKIVTSQVSVHLLSIITENAALSEAQKKALINDFNRSLGLIKLEGVLRLTPDQATIIYGAVNGLLAGLASVLAPVAIQ